MKETNHLKKKKNEKLKQLKIAILKQSINKKMHIFLYFNENNFNATNEHHMMIKLFSA